MANCDKAIDSIVFSACRGGLANRLRALYGLIALSRIENIPFRLYWEPNLECPAEFLDLFEVPPFELMSEENLTSCRNRRTRIYDTSVWFDQVHRVESGHSLRRSEAFYLEIRNAMRLVVPVAEIRAQVDRFTLAVDICKRVGFHIRYTDNLRPYSEWGLGLHSRFNAALRSTLEGFSHAMRSCRQPMYLATDNPEVLHDFRRRFDGNLAFYPKSFRQSTSSSQRTTGIPDALIELLLLTRCRSIVGSYYSSFGKLAAIMDGASYREIRGRSIVKNYSVMVAQCRLATHRGGCSPLERLRMLLAPPL